VKKLVVLVVLGMLSLTACRGSNDLLVSAKFTDISDLAPSAPVMMNDVKVGEVKGIHLAGNMAQVTMALDPKASVPSGVIARVRRTSLLGERIVDLQIPDGQSPNAPPLRNGAVIADTIVRPDLEDLVQAGNNVLAPITASEIATLVNEGYKGFGHSGGDLRHLLDNFGTIVHAYSTRTGEISTLIDSLNELNTTVAAHAPAHAAALRNTARALDVLRNQSVRLQTAIKALNRLAIGGRGILEAHFDEMSRFFGQMRVILSVLVQEQGSIDRILQYAPLHNRNTQLVEFQEFNQVFQDFVICNFNDNPNDPARNCTGGKGTQP
jgi:phospholipid/cholesterol/gamma-HCH transport system substrate-binding protein